MAGVVGWDQWSSSLAGDEFPSVVGLEVVVVLAQAVEQFELWTGSKPDIEVIRTAALRGLSG